MKHHSKPQFEKIFRNPKRELFEDKYLSIKKQSTAHTLAKVIKILNENGYAHISRKNVHNSESRYVCIFDKGIYSNKQVILRISMHVNASVNVNGPCIDLYISDPREGAINIHQLVSTLDAYFEHTIKEEL